MMPARFSRMIWNVPYFAAYTISVWLGFHFLFVSFDYVPSSRDHSEETYITALVIASFFGMGVVIEASVLIFRKHWPAPQNDGIVVVTSPQVSSKEEQVQSAKVVAVDDFADITVYNIGRPTSEDLLADAARASAPGIFVCGPVGLVQTLRDAAAAENSPFGLLTRYAIYEESFEM